MSESNKRTYRIGVTGGVCAGKTLVCKAMEKYGVSVFDTSNIVNNLIQSQPQITQQAVEIFGDYVLDSHGRLATKKLSYLLLTSTQQKTF